VEPKGLISGIGCFETITRFRVAGFKEMNPYRRRLGGPADHNGCVAVERAAERKFLGMMCLILPT
jgi:hypothetical protein